MKLGWDRTLWVEKVLPTLVMGGVCIALLAMLMEELSLPTVGPLPVDRYLYPEEEAPPPAPSLDWRWYALLLGVALPIGLGAGVSVWRRRAEVASAVAEGVPDVGVKPLQDLVDRVVIPPEDTRFAALVTQGESFEAPVLSSRFDPFRLRATTTGASELEAMEFTPGAVLIELAAIVQKDGSTLLPGVLEFLGALRTAGVPRAFVVVAGPPALLGVLGGFGPVHHVQTTLAHTLKLAAEGLGVEPTECAAVVGSAGSVAQAHGAECLAIAIAPPGGTALALSGADLLVSRLRAEWVQADGRFRMT